MKAYIISDSDFPTDTYNHLYHQITKYFTDKGFDIAHTQVGRNDVASCIGCFSCWVKSPGECAIHDPIAQINKDTMNSDVVIYLSPIVFGQFSANIKNILDRWIPNILPFFEIRKDGTTMHPPRYQSYPKQIMLGYADHLSKDDAQLFIDITMKHRRSIDVIIYHDSEQGLVNALDQSELERAGDLL